MSNVLPFTPSAAASSIADIAPAETRPPYTFDILQSDSAGMVLIDACVPLALAVEFMQLLAEYDAGIIAHMG